MDLGWGAALPSLGGVGTLGAEVGRGETRCKEEACPEAFSRIELLGMSLGEQDTTVELSAPSGPVFPFGK